MVTGWITGRISLWLNALQCCILKRLVFFFCDACVWLFLFSPTGISGCVSSISWSWVNGNRTSRPNLSCSTSPSSRSVSKVKVTHLSGSLLRAPGSYITDECLYISFYKKKTFVGQKSFLWGHRYPCFGLDVTSSLFFKVVHFQQGQHLTGFFQVWLIV